MRTAILAMLLPLPAQAVQCVGSDPFWTFDTATGSFVYDGQSTLTLRQDDLSLNDASIRAMTFTGPRDSLIAILTEGACGQTASLTILTQSGETPIILSGCCLP